MKNCIRFCILLTWIYLSVAFTFNTTNTDCRGSYYERANNDYSGRIRLSYLKRGDFRIQGLLAVTNKTQLCNEITNFGLLRVYAMKYAIDSINNDNKLIPNFTLGLQIDNVCNDLPATMARAMEIISQHRPHSTCRADFLKCEQGFKDVSPAIGIIGTKVSFSTIPLASMVSLYNIPLVSHTASSTLLSNRTNYPSFFRTMPSDKHQIQAMLAVIKKFRWNYVVAIGSDDDYGRQNVADLKKHASSDFDVDLCVVNDTYIPYGSEKTTAKIDAAIKLLEKEETRKAKVVILFCYVKDLGDMILKKAKERGVKRIWLTSDLWNPAALVLPSDQAEGILTVSIHSYPMKYLVKYIENEIRTKWKCDVWLQKYFRGEKKCMPTNLVDNSTTFVGNSTTKFGGRGCRIDISELVDELSTIPGEVYNLVNSVYALAHGIHSLIQQKCPKGVKCSSVTLSPSELTNAMHNVSFVNQEGELISFDENGDPKYAYYSIDNIQRNENNKTKVVRVGNWTDTHGLTIDQHMIKWPRWFSSGNETGGKYPFSRCNPDCEPGEYIVSKKGCCWECKKCVENQYTDQLNARNYSDCGLFHHTIDNKNCILTNVDWLKVTDAPGKALIIFSAFGFALLLLAIGILIKYWKFVIIGSQTPHMITLYCVMLFISYAFGAFLVIMPSEHTCSAMTTIFYLMLMTYICVLIIQTRFWNDYVVDGITDILNGNVFRSHLLSLLGYLVVEAATVVAWLHSEGLGYQVEAYKDHKPDSFLLWKQCRVDTTATRYISTFVPIVILVIATFTSFRERNGDHCFHEPKFISFGCIALCIITIAFLPTYHIVDRKYKAITMAIALDVFACTYIACFIMPKIFVGIMRAKKGIGLYPLRPGSERKGREENDEGNGAAGGKVSSPSFNSMTRTTKDSVVSLTTTVNNNDEIHGTSTNDFNHTSNGHVNNNNNQIPTINEE